MPWWREDGFSDGRVKEAGVSAVGAWGWYVGCEEGGQADLRAEDVAERVCMHSTISDDVSDGLEVRRL